MVTHVSEVIGLDEVDGVIQVDDIFAEVDGELGFSGYLPSFIQQLVEERLIDLRSLFPPAERDTR
jgi:hypothetical protein